MSTPSIAVPITLKNVDVLTTIGSEHIDLALPQNASGNVVLTLGATVVSGGITGDVLIVNSNGTLGQSAGGGGGAVASLTLVNQTSVPSGAFTLYTPSIAGLYSLSVYMVGIEVGGAGSSILAMQVGYTDSSTTVQYSSASQALSSTGAFIADSDILNNTFGAGSGISTIYAVAGQPIQYSFDNTLEGPNGAMSLVGGDKFSVYAKLVPIN
jgi:hypothetical protein